MIIILAWSTHIKLAMTLNLTFFKTLLMLAIQSLEDSINLNLFSLLIEIMICFLDGTFVIMFIFGLSLPLLLIIFWMFFELTLLEKLDLPLIMSISMSMSMSILDGSAHKKIRKYASFHLNYYLTTSYNSQNTIQYRHRHRHRY